MTVSNDLKLKARVSGGGGGKDSQLKGAGMLVRNLN